MGTKSRDLAPPLRLSDGAWLQALEIAFRSVGNAMPLPEIHTVKPGKSILGIETPPEHKLLLNILFGAPATTEETLLPDDMQGPILLETRFRNSMRIVVIARVMPYSFLDYEYILGKLDLRVKFASPVRSAGVEVYELATSPTQGNVISVLTLGKEAFAPNSFDEHS